MVLEFFYGFLVFEAKQKNILSLRRVSGFLYSFDGGKEKNWDFLLFGTLVLFFNFLGFFIKENLISIEVRKLEKCLSQYFFLVGG